MRTPSFLTVFVAWLASVMLLPLTAGAATGDLDSFDASPNSFVNAAVVQPDGRILLGGAFAAVDGVSRRGMARCNADGTLDTNFVPIVEIPNAITVQDDGKILVGGTFTSINGVPRNRMARLNADGSLDDSFNPNLGNFVNAVVQQPDGRLLIGGEFNTVGATVRSRLARLETNGTLDVSFNPAPNAEVRTVALQPDGKILLGGTFSAVGGVTRNRVARLNADGTLDITFTTGVVGLIGLVHSLAVQPDGKILMGGTFTNVNGVTRGHIARLNTNGTVDSSFTPSTDASVDSLALQADGKILMGGAFASVNGVARTYLARLNSNGTLDPALNVTIFGSGVYSVALQADGKIVLAGLLGVVGGVPNLARLENDPATQNLTAPTPNRVQWMRGGTAPEARYVTLESSTNGGASYAFLGHAARITGGWELTGLSLPLAGQLRARARVMGGRYDGSDSLVESVAQFGNQPEVGVVGNSINIADGDGAPSLADHTDFGSVTVTGSTLVRTFTITNSGNTNLTLGPVTIGGTHAADFVVNLHPAASVAPNGTTTFQVTFDPSAPGLRSGTLNFANNDLDENPFNFSIQGTGTTPEIAVTGNGVNIVDGDNTPSLTDHTDFGSVNVTGSTLVRTFSISNSGTANLTPGMVALGGTHAADFVVNVQPAASVAPNGSTTFQITFNPSVIGLRSATLSVANDDLDENPFNFSIQGTGTAPEIAVTGNGFNITDGDNTPSLTDHTDFGAVNVTGSTLFRIFTITNSGNTTLTLSPITLGGAHAADFLLNVPPTPSVAPNGSTTFQVIFDPSALGLRSATLSFGNDDVDENPFNFSIQGTGITREIAVTGNSLDIADGDITPSLADHTDFGGVNVTGSTLVRTFTITNSGNIDLSLGTVTVGGLQPGDFVVNVQPAASVPPNGSTTFQITFDPGASGLRGATLSLTNNDFDENPFNFSIRGTGIAPEIAVTGNSLDIPAYNVSPRVDDHTDFGSIAVASGSILRTFTITNSGETSLTLGSVAISGPHATDFVVSAQPAATVGTNSSTTFQITFDPSAVGLRSATVSFANDDLSENPFTFSIQGTGTAFEIAVTGNSLDIADGDNTPSLADHTEFGSVNVTGSTLVRTFTITNGGNAILTLGPITVGGPHAADFVVNVQPFALVSPNGNTLFQITFDPSASGLRSATLSFTNSDLDESPFNFSIQGTGTTSEIAVAGNGLNIADGDLSPSVADHTDFGSVATTNGAIARTFTITNSGTGSLTLGPVTVGGLHALDFFVTAQPTTTVGTNGSTTFQISFDPSAVGLRSATLSLVNNDGDENPFNFGIQGTGLASEIAVSGNDVNIADNDNTPNVSDHTDFGSVNVTGSTLVRTFTITNSGTESLTLGSVGVSGPHSVDFTVTAQPAATVPPNGSTTFQVSFDPSAIGLRNAAILSFSNNDSDENPFSFNLQGTGIASEIVVTGNGLNIADGDNTPSVSDHTDFGGVATASGNIVRTFTITNSGNISLTLGPIIVGGTHAGDFLLILPPGASVAPNGSTTFQLMFDPIGSGLRSATLSFTNSDSNENPFNFSIQGTGTTPEIAMAGNSVNITNGASTPSAADHTDFGSISVPSGNILRTFTITNSGTANLALGVVTVGGTHALDFFVTAQPTATVDTNGSTTFQISFDPRAVGLRSATLSLANNDSDENPFNFSIQGTGAAPEIAVTGNNLDISDGDFGPSIVDHTDFGSVNVIGSSLVRTFTITNSGNIDLALGNVTIGGTHAAEFIVSAQPAASVGANGSTTFQITFDPADVGLRLATLSFTNNDSDENPFNFSIQGSGIGPEIAVNGNTINIIDGDDTPIILDHTEFGSIAVASGSILRTFTITNRGEASLALGTVAIGGPHAADFVVSAQPAATVGTNGSTTFQITFDPIAVGLRSATLSFTNNDSDENPFSFSIQGTGLAPEIAVSGNLVNIADGDNTPSLADHRDFGSVAAASGTIARTFTITNSGTLSLSLGGFTIGGPHAADFRVNLLPIPSVAPNGGATFQVTFDPSASGLRSATLSFTNSDLDENPFNFSIQGTGLNTENASPTLNSLSNAVINEDSGLRTVSLTGISAGAGETQTLTVTATSDNTNVVPHPTILYTTPNASGVLSYTPVANASGIALITVTVNDGAASNNITTRTFTVTVTEVNDAPTVVVNDPPLIFEDAGLQTVNITGISAGGGETQVLTITAVSGNTNIIPHPTVTYTSPNTNGSLSYTPVTNAAGSAVIAVTINDGGTSNNITTRTFTVIINPQNDPPTAINLAAPETYIEDTPLNLIDIVVNDVDSGVRMSLQVSPPDAGSLSTATSGSATSTFNPGTGVWVASGPVSNINALLAEVIFTPTPDYNLPFFIVSGAASDNGGFPISGIKSMTGVPVNDLPTLAAISDLVMDEDGGLQNVSLTGISAGGGESQTLTVTATSGNTNVIPHPPTIIYSTPGAIGTLRFTPVANASGTAVITVMLNDGGTSNNITTQTFTVTVNAVNDVPSFTKGSDQSHPYGTTNAQIFVGWATGIIDGDASVTQELSFNVTHNNPGLFATPPRIAADGTLTYTPNGSNGTATVSVSVTDDAIAGGPALTSALQTFTIAVSAPTVVAPPVIDPQSLKLLGNGSLQFSFTNTNNVAFSVLAATDPSLPASNWTVLGVATNIDGGRHAFTDPQATNFPKRFYLLRFP